MKRCNSMTCMALGIAGLALASGCGTEPTPPLQPISVTVTPTTVSLVAGASQDFSATVANDPAVKGVTWSITGCTGGVGVCGSLSNVTHTGVTYTAPARVPPGGPGVTATSIADNAKWFTATVAITALSTDSRIAFTSSRDGCPNIYTMNPDGSSVVPLTNCAYGGGDRAAWSPDRTKIAYQRRSGSSWRIDVGNADGTAFTAVAAGWTPAWSPNATKIAAGSYYYICSRDCVSADQVVVMSANGSDPVVLARCQNRSFCGEPTWSPDGQRIAFRAGNAIYVANADGTGSRILSDSSDSQPAWSPDGRRIAFVSRRSGTVDLYLMNPDGSGVERLTDDSVAEERPAWSPDGTMIAFASTRDGNWEIYVMNADGSWVRRLTNQPASDDSPAWAP